VQIKMQQPLENLQNLIYRLITAPDGIEQALAAERRLPARGIGAIIRGNERLPSAGRLQIYSDAYFFRLLEVMKEDYPAVLAVLGANDFQSLIRDYLAAHPPHKPSVFYAGEFVADFVQRRFAGGQLDFVSDLARLERALIESFHGPDAAALTADELKEIAPEDWPGLAMRAHPTVIVVRSRWQIAGVRRAIDAKQEWTEPQHQRSRILVWRQDDVTYYRELEETEYEALDLLCEGANFAAICDAVASSQPRGGELAATVNRLLYRWLADGVLATGETHESA
jgi:hypothetical protein